MGINTIAMSVGEEAGTIKKVYEPFLIQEGYLKRTARGREATESAFRHMEKIFVIALRRNQKGVLNLQQIRALLLLLV